MSTVVSKLLGARSDRAAWAEPDGMKMLISQMYNGNKGTAVNVQQNCEKCTIGVGCHQIAEIGKKESQRLGGLQALL